MFGSNNDKQAKSSRKASPLASGLPPNNSLVEGTRIEGTIQADHDLRIDGKVNGKIHCKGKVILGPTGRIEGDIHCQNAVLEGHFSGNLLVDDLLQVMETARVEGDVNTRKLIVQAGSIFNVNCQMGGQKVKDKQTAQEDKHMELQKLTRAAQS